MLRRAWAAGAAPQGERLTIDSDATRVATYGPGKQDSTFSQIIAAWPEKAWSDLL